MHAMELTPIASNSGDISNEFWIREIGETMTLVKAPKSVNKLQN
jgi:hypothetical protein